MFDPNILLTNLLNRNPNIANNPQAQSMINAIRTGNASLGEQIATNLCNTYGVSKDDAIQQAMAFFNIRK